MVYKEPIRTMLFLLPFSAVNAQSADQKQVIKFKKYSMNNLGKSIMSHGRKYMVFYIVFFSTTVSTSFINAQNPDSSSLKKLAAKHNLLIGGATDLNHNDSNEEQLIINEFR
jgi:hypothetical protein